MTAFFKRLFFASSSLFFVLSFSCDRSPVDEVTPLQRMTLGLSGKGYNRSRDLHPYSITYRAEPPNTVVIIAKYKNEYDHGELNTVIESAKGMLRDEALTYHVDDLHIKVETSKMDN